MRLSAPVGKGRNKPPDVGNTSSKAVEDFAEGLGQRAVHSPAFRGYVRSHANLLRRVPLQVLQAAASAVHQRSWTVAKDKLSSLDRNELLKILDQYLRHHLASDQAWEAEMDNAMEEDSTASEAPAESPQEPQKATPYYSFGSWSGEILAGMKLAKEALQRQLQMLSLLADGQQPSDSDINSLTQVAAGALGTLNGLAGGCDLMLDRYKECRASDVPIVAAASHPDAAPVSRAPTQRRPLSYREVASRSLSTALKKHDPKVPTDIHREEMLRKRKEAFGDMKKAIRADDRAFRLIQTEKSQPMALGIVGKAFLEGIKWPKTERSPIEDIRRDGRGNYYIQIYQTHFRLAEKRIKDRRDTEYRIDLPALGATLVKDPKVCERAGMIPAVITRVHQNWDMKQVTEQIWDENKQRWQLADITDPAQHLIVDRRLSRRDPNSEDPSTRIPSQTLKIWLSADLAAKIDADGSALRFDYQIKEVRRFEDSLPGRRQAARAQ